MTKAEDSMKKRLTVIECIILAIGVLLSILGTVKAVKQSDAYIPYFLFAVLGIAFIVILICLIKKRFTFLAGIGFIVFYLIFAGFGYIVCEVNATRLKRLSYYKDKEVRLVIGSDEYAWTGEAVFSSKDLTPLDVRKDNAVFKSGNEKLNVGFVYYKPGENDTVYYEFSSGATGNYMVMRKISQAS